MKLGDLLQFPKQSKTMANLCNLKNSLKRNIALPSKKLLHSSAQQQYQTKLTGHNFAPKDLNLLFQHLYSKQNMDKSDKNLLKRLLLSYFPQEIIYAAGKPIIEHSMYRKFVQEQVVKGKRQFCMVLSGKIRLESASYYKDITVGMYTGHLQILCNVKQYRLIFSPGTIILIFSQQSFYKLFKHYFESIYLPKKTLIPEWISKNISQEQEYLLCDTMIQKYFPPASIIKKKGDTVQSIYFFKKQQILQSFGDIAIFKEKMNCLNTLGIAEYFLRKKRYEQNIFIKEQVHFYQISLLKFQQFIPRKTFQEAKQIVKLGIIVSRGNTETISPSNTDRIEVLQKFMRIKKVKLPYSKTIKTCNSETIEESSIRGSSLKRKNNPSNHQLGQKYSTNFMFFNEKRTNSLQKSKMHFQAVNKSQIKKADEQMTKYRRKLKKKRVETSLK